MPRSEGEAQEGFASDLDDVSMEDITEPAPPVPDCLRGQDKVGYCLSG